MGCREPVMPIGAGSDQRFFSRGVGQELSFAAGFGRSRLACERVSRGTGRQSSLRLGCDRGAACCSLQMFPSRPRQYHAELVLLPMQFLALSAPNAARVAAGAEPGQCSFLKARAHNILVGNSVPERALDATEK